MSIVSTDRLAALLALPLLACGPTDEGAPDGTDAGTVDAAPQPYGPDNTWFHATDDVVPTEQTGTGLDEGSTLGNVFFVDQFGDDVELYQFWGKTVQLVLFTEWCSTCRAEAPELQQAWEDLQDDDVMVLGVMLEDDMSMQPTPEVLMDWADTFGITHPLLIDVDDALWNMVQGGYPTLPIVDGEMTVVSADNWPFTTGPLAP